MSAYFDYRLKFPVTGLATALQAIAALQATGLLGAGDIPDNMLGDARDASGAVVDRASGTVAWLGSQGVAASAYTDPDTGLLVNVPARGDPAYYYIHIRSNVPPSALPFDPASYGMVPSDPVESAAVLGVWE